MRKLNLNKIRETITDRGWSQNELARRAGMSSPGILKTLRGDNEPKLSTALAIADALGMELEELLEAEQPPEDDSHQLALAM
jgi:transcriptional regulator with XRE-family HTH domain